MKQKTFHFINLEELQCIIPNILNDDYYKNATGVLIQLHNPRFDIDEDKLVLMLTEAFPDACVSGITAANIAGEDFDISNFPVEISFTFFNHTRLIQYDFDLSGTTSYIAGREMNEYLEKISDLKCLQIFYASNSASINTFMKEFNHQKLAIFGVKAGRCITKKNTAKVYGKKVYVNGIVVVAFVSDCLKIYMDNNLGWQPIGVEMAITKTSGNSIISEIDKKPAIDIYTKYLKVEPDKYFVENVCEFPLVIEHGDLKIARVPSAYDDTGAIYLTSDVSKGDHFRLSYADKDLLHSLTCQSANELADYKPEAVYIFECGNRMRFLKRESLNEISQYDKCGVELFSAASYAELFVTKDGFGGDLNSTLVAIGLKEDPDGEDVVVLSRDYEKCDVTVKKTGREIPFIERILAFLESTSQELDEMNKELGKIAYTDRLTKVCNRWELEKEIDEYLELNRQGKPYGLLFLDIDHFKLINDNYGHDVGDITLQTVVNLVREKLDTGHALGRWGGEEFVYLVPDVDEKSLYDFAESIRKSIDEICFIPVKHLTISIGATMARPDDTLETFVKRADDAVYEAKETGRNKVVVR
ncbi:MAG: GGDEF domain-containing protein [Lachnospiraceae bacterium]|nr:GGDEF domain-containing protein [Lachnospiraceae bacterium]